MRRLQGLGESVATGLRRAVPHLESAAVRAGLLDFPVQPVRSRRLLGLAALVYLIGVSGGLVIWWLLPK